MAFDPGAFWAKYKAAILSAIAGFLTAVAGGAEIARAAYDAVLAIVRAVIGI